MQLTPIQEFGIAGFGILVGAFYQFVFPDTAAKALSTPQRLYSMFQAAVLTGFLAAIALFVVHWNALIVGFLGLLIGGIADKFMRLWIAYNNQAGSLLTFLGNLRKAYQIVKGRESNSDNTTHE